MRARLTASLAPHLRDLPIPALLAELDGRPALARRLAVAVHKRGALTWDEVGLGQRTRFVRERFRFGPQLAGAGTREASDGTRKYLYRLATGEVVETVLIRNRDAWTLCVSSQAGCALGCAFCATGKLGLRRDLTAGEITESVHRTQRAAGVRVTDVVFMGQGEPLHNYDAVMDACTNLNHDLGPCISRKKITVSTAGLLPGVERFTRERRPWRLHLSLHSAVPETREQLMPVARRWPLAEVIDAMRAYQEQCGRPWVTLQYVAIPGVNMDDRHVEALAERLSGLAYILNVIPVNDADAGFRPPTWAEVKTFTNKLRKLGCPVKIRYSAGKQDGMGCGQLAAEQVATTPTGGHTLAPPGIFTT